MKSVKFITTFLLLFVLSIFISYANIEGNNWTDNFIETFKQTNAKFKYYDIKINSTVSNEKTEKDIKNICIDTINCFGINKNKIKWNIKKQNKEVKIYAKVKDNNYSISFAAIKKNNKEYYIIIDISNNKVYKNIDNGIYILNMPKKYMIDNKSKIIDIDSYSVQSEPMQTELIDKKKEE